MTQEKQTKREPRQGAMLHSSSSSRRQDPPPKTYRATTVGCMSGIFRLFSNHHSTRRKFLSFRKKEESRSRTETESRGSAEVDRRIPIESPMRPQGIRRRTSSVATEKRMLLLGALAKCDEDLRELKKIIEELKTDRNDGVEAEIMPRKAKDELVTELSSGEQPSPVSVLDELTRSPPFSRCAGRRRSLQYGNINQQQEIKRRHEEEFLGSLHFQRAPQHGGNNSLSGSPLWCSRAMVETVEKACIEIAWGEKRERGRIGMALQDQIYRDLIEETVMEIGKIGLCQHLKLSYTNGKLHGRGCRRRLSY